MTNSESRTASTSHTPGPWSVPHFAEPDVNCMCKYVLCDHMMGAVASVHCSGDGDDWQAHGDNPKFAEAVANAHLIAAAPELLDALTAILYWEAAFHTSLNPSDIEAAWLAVTKATGGTLTEQAPAQKAAAT